MRDWLAAVWRLLRTEHGWSRVWVSLGMAITMAGGGLIYYQTTGGGDDPLQFPNPSTTGVPSGWSPTTTRSTDLEITVDNTVIEDYRFTNAANVIISGGTENVTIRRSEFLGGVINNQPGQDQCGNGLLIEDVTITTTSPGAPHNDGEGVISYGGYTARRVEINDRSEGFRVSGGSFGCTDVVIEDSYELITPPTPCYDQPPDDWHGDGIQSNSPELNVSVDNLTVDMRDTEGSPANPCYGTAPIFLEEGSADVNHILVMGQGYAYRQYVPGSVSGLRIVNNTWVFNPVLVESCGSIAPWEAKIVTIDANYRVTSEVEDQPCETG